MSFKQFYENQNVKTRLCVYDFDGTIANVPERPKNWEGKDWWGHPDSLGDSYFDGSVNQEVIEAFKKDRADPAADVILLTGRRGVIASHVRKVMKANELYGRRMIPASNKTVMDRYRSALLAGDDVEHPDERLGHEEYYSGDHSTEDDFPKTEKGKPDGTTLIFKLYIIEQKKMTGNIEIVEFWDDRADHAPHFIQLGQRLLKQYGVERGGKLQSVILHRVFAPTYRGGQGTIQHVPIRPGMVY